MNLLVQFIVLSRCLLRFNRFVYRFFFSLDLNKPSVVNSYSPPDCVAAFEVGYARAYLNRYPNKIVRLFA